jgi:hypothetical protein
MAQRSAFHLDCTAIFPACRFECTKCMEEVWSILTPIPGVEGLCTAGEGADTRLIVVHDPSRVTAERLLEILGRLPSFSEASFAPTLLG